MHSTHDTSMDQNGAESSFTRLPNRSWNAGDQDEASDQGEEDGVRPKGKGKGKAKAK